MRRMIPALVGATALAVILTACAPSINESTETRVSAAGCSNPYASGDASSIVTAEGDAGTAPTVEFPTPLVSTTSQVSELVEGDGAELRDGDLASVGLTLALGETGETAQTIGYEKGSTVLRSVGAAAETETALDKSLLCQKVGSRYALTSTIEKILGADQAQSSGLDPDTTLVVVVDVKARFLGKADGTNQLQDNALPAVVTAVDGQPGIVLPGTAAPKKDREALVKAGSGAKVKKGDTVVVQFSQFTWGDEATAGTSTWENGSAGLVVAGEASTDTPFAEQLSGERVGSQLMIVQPGASADADAQIYVVDVLGVLG